MLRDNQQYMAASKEVQRLQSLIRSGDATDRDRQRYEEGSLELVCWDWETTGHDMRKANRPPVHVVEAPPRDPRAVRFIDWWERNNYAYPDHVFWMDLFDAWIEPLALSDEEMYALYLEASDEYHSRAYVRAHADVEGMVVTDHAA